MIYHLYSYSCSTRLSFLAHDFLLQNVRRQSSLTRASHARTYSSDMAYLPSSASAQKFSGGGGGLLRGPSSAVLLPATRNPSRRVVAKGPGWGLPGRGLPEKQGEAAIATKLPMMHKKLKERSALPRDRAAPPRLKYDRVERRLRGVAEASKKPAAAPQPSPELETAVTASPPLPPSPKPPSSAPLLQPPPAEVLSTAAPEAVASEQGGGGGEQAAEEEEFNVDIAMEAAVTRYPSSHARQHWRTAEIVADVGGSDDAADQLANLIATTDKRTACWLGPTKSQPQSSEFASESFPSLAKGREGGGPLPPPPQQDMMASVGELQRELDALTLIIDSLGANAAAAVKRGSLLCARSVVHRWLAELIASRPEGAIPPPFAEASRMVTAAAEGDGGGGGGRVAPPEEQTRSLLHGCLAESFSRSIARAVCTAAAMGDATAAGRLVIPGAGGGTALPAAQRAERATRRGTEDLPANPI